MADNIDHGFWDILTDEPQEKKKIYPPHIVRKATPQQRKDNIAWAEQMGGVRFDETFNPTYVIFRDCIYNVYNGDLYKPTYFQNENSIALFKMQRGVYKDRKDDQIERFSWNHLMRVYQPKSKFPKP